MRYAMYLLNEEKAVTDFYEPTENEYKEACQEFNAVLDKHLDNLYKIIAENDTENVVEKRPVKKATGNMKADLGKSRYKVKKGIAFMVIPGSFEADTREEYLRICKSLNRVVSKLNKYCKENSLTKLKFSPIIKDNHETVDGKPVPTTSEMIRGDYIYIPKKR